MKSSPSLLKAAPTSAWQPAELRSMDSGAGLSRPGTGPQLWEPGLLILEPLPAVPQAPLRVESLFPLAAEPDLKAPAAAYDQWLPKEFAAPKPQAAPEDQAGLREEVIRGALRQAQEQAQEEARQLLQAAQQQADELVQAAARSAAQVTALARQAGLEQARAGTTGLLELAQNLVEEVRIWREEMLAQSEPLVVNLVQEIARKLFGEGFVLDRETLQRVFARALDEAATLGALRLRAHPEDVTLLDPLWPSQQTALRGQSIELVPNQEIQRGGCYIEGQYGSVDARVKTQMRLVTETVDTVLADHAPVSDPFIPYVEDQAG